MAEQHFRNGCGTNLQRFPKTDSVVLMGVECGISLAWQEAFRCHKGITWYVAARYKVGEIMLT